MIKYKASCRAVGTEY